MLPFSTASFNKFEPAKKATRLPIASAIALSAFATASLADTPSVVTSIKPIHSIASAVMDGVGKPFLLIDGATSPHGFALKPSQAFLLQGADTVFWIGPGLASSLAKPISSMAGDASVELMEAEGIEHLGLREGATFDTHDHDHGSHSEGHEEHEEAGHDDHGHDDGEKEEHAHDDHAPEGGERDAHIWLNPDNGIAIAGAMAETLAQVDPANADIYRANAKKFSERIEGLETKISAKLEPVSGQKFIVFHDAYHHFEHHFNVEASGSITLTPEAIASADRLSTIQDTIQDLDVSCVFQEPQFDSKIVNVAIEGSKARIGTLDPLGTEIANGIDLYPTLLMNLADSLADCLGGE
ncbi:High-affinity zinc uptake system protein ZnuA precursor [Roseibium album]|nr:High-affinity zinc uptake system protein ZnuA precursor [Roseibium album]